MPLEDLEGLIVQHKSQLQSLTTDYQVKLKEKLELVTQHKNYYGQKCQLLLEEIVTSQPNDPETGERATLKSVIKKIGIDVEKIRFRKEDEEFEEFK